MQYGHCVVSATAIAISSLYFFGIAPSARASLSQSLNACIVSGTSSATWPSLLTLVIEYMFFHPFKVRLITNAHMMWRTGLERLTDRPVFLAQKPEVREVPDGCTFGSVARR